MRKYPTFGTPSLTPVYRSLFLTASSRSLKTPQFEHCVKLRGPGLLVGLSPTLSNLFFGEGGHASDLPFFKAPKIRIFWLITGLNRLSVLTLMKAFRCGGGFGSYAFPRARFSSALE